MMENMEALIEEKRYDEAFEKGSRFAIGMGRKFHVEGLEKEDIDNEALYTLWTAIKCYNRKVGASFKTYLGKCLSHNMMYMLKYSKRQKRDREGTTIEELAIIFRKSHVPNLSDKIDLHYFLPAILPSHLVPLLKEFLRCGSFRDAGRTLGYTFNETRYLRRCILDALKEKWLKDGEA